MLPSSAHNNALEAMNAAQARQDSPEKGPSSEDLCDDTDTMDEYEERQAIPKQKKLELKRDSSVP